MKKASAKIKEVVRTKDHTNNYGTTVYHDLVMDNGDKIQIGKKSLQKVGWELSYEVIDEGQEFNKARSIKPEEVQGTNVFAKSNESFKTPVNGVNVQNLIVAQSSVASACNFLRDKNADIEDILRYSGKIYEWVLSKG